MGPEIRIVMHHLLYTVGSPRSPEAFQRIAVGEEGKVSDPIRIASALVSGTMCHKLICL